MRNKKCLLMHSAFRLRSEWHKLEWWYLQVVCQSHRVWYDSFGKCLFDMPSVLPVDFQKFWPVFILQNKSGSNILDRQEYTHSVSQGMSIFSLQKKRSHILTIQSWNIWTAGFFPSFLLFLPEIGSLSGPIGLWAGLAAWAYRDQNCGYGGEKP